MAANPQRRRDKRYLVELPISVKSGTTTRKLLTHNVSFRGLFVRTDDPPVPRTLLRLDAELPPNDERFRSHGMAVWIVTPEEATEEQPPGIGVQFYAMGAERIKWEAFILWARRTAEQPIVDAEPVADVKPPTPDAVRRAHPRREIHLRVCPRTVDELLEMYSRDVSKGGMFVRTDRAFDVNTVLQLDVSHPETHQVFGLEAIVRRLAKTGDRGIGVEFQNSGEQQLEAFHQFVHSTIEELSLEDLAFVDDADVKLE